MMSPVELKRTSAECDHATTDRRVALKLLWLLGDPKSPIEQITRAISADPALTARILALANLPTFRARGVTSVARAASVLGPGLVRSLSSTAALELFSEQSEPDGGLWLHSITTAVAAARVAGCVRVNAAEALTVGLLHDYGEQILRARDPQRFDEIAGAIGNQRPHSRLTIERRLFGTDHALVGAQGLSDLGLPATLTKAIHEHHASSENQTPLAAVLQSADAIAHVLDGAFDEDVLAPLRRHGVHTQNSDKLIAATEVDRSALLKFLSEFIAPRAEAR